MVENDSYSNNPYDPQRIDRREFADRDKEYPELKRKLEQSFSSSSLLCITGEAGIGKSMMAQTIVNDIIEEKNKDTIIGLFLEIKTPLTREEVFSELLGSFIENSKDLSSGTVDFIYSIKDSSVISREQLFLSGESTFEGTEKDMGSDLGILNFFKLTMDIRNKDELQIKREEAVRTRSKIKITWKFLSDLLKSLLKTETNSGKKFIILIDNLDRLNEESAREVVMALESLRDSSTKEAIAMIITVRPEFSDLLQRYHKPQWIYEMDSKGLFNILRKRMESDRDLSESNKTEFEIKAEMISQSVNGNPLAFLKWVESLRYNLGLKWNELIFNLFKEQYGIRKAREIKKIIELVQQFFDSSEEFLSEAMLLGSMDDLKKDFIVDLNRKDLLHPKRAGTDNKEWKLDPLLYILKLVESDTEGDDSES